MLTVVVIACSNSDNNSNNDNGDHNNSNSNLYDIRFHVCCHLKSENEYLVESFCSGSGVCL